MINFEATKLLITPIQARDFLGHDNYQWQRDIKEQHVRRLAAAMDAGTFRAGTVIEFCTVGDQRWLVDGQHTLSAIVRANKPVWLLVKTNFCESAAEVAQIYATFNRDLTRRIGEAVAAWCRENQIDLTKKQVEEAIGATKWLLTGFRPPTVSLDSIVASDLLYVAGEMRDRLSAAQLYYEIVGDAQPGLEKPMRRAPLVAVGLALLERTETMGRAGEFLRAVAEDSAAKGHPARALSNFLLREKKPSPLHQVRTAASCWNAFWEARKLDFAKPGFQGMIGITLRGTKYRARQPASHRTVAIGNRNMQQRGHRADAGAGLPLAARTAR